MSDEIERKRSFIGYETRQVTLQHDNVRLHVAKETKDTMFLELGSSLCGLFTGPSLIGLPPVSIAPISPSIDMHFKTLEEEKALMTQRHHIFFETGFANSKGGAKLLKITENTRT